jgi:hypothetical protein
MKSDSFRALLVREATSEYETYTNYATAVLARYCENWGVEEILQEYELGDRSAALSENMQESFKEAYLGALEENTIEYTAMETFLNLVNWRQLAVRELDKYDDILTKEEMEYF